MPPMIGEPGPPVKLPRRAGPDYNGPMKATPMPSAGAGPRTRRRVRTGLTLLMALVLAAAGPASARPRRRAVRSRPAAPAPPAPRPAPSPRPEDAVAEPGYDRMSASYRVLGPSRVRVAGAGDIMLQQRLRAATDQRNRGEANHDGYDELFPSLHDALADADLAIANMEFPVFAKPMRGAPFVFYGTSPVLGAIRAAGFTMVTSANNHGFDQGRDSPASTARECKQAGLPCVGVGEDRTEAEAPYTIELNGMTIAVIGYALISNGDLNRDRDDAPRVNGFRIEPLLTQVRAAASRADAVIVAVHWGVEYTTTETAPQRAWARQIAEAGATVIFGHHPHVLEPIEQIETASGRKVLVCYSLGNFTTNQGGGGGDPVTKLGAIVKADLAPTERGVEAVSWETLATWVYNGAGPFEGKTVTDVHVEVAPLMIERLQRELAAETDLAAKKRLEGRIAFYQGRVAAARKILKLPDSAARESGGT